MNETSDNVFLLTFVPGDNNSVISRHPDGTIILPDREWGKNPHHKELKPGLKCWCTLYQPKSNKNFYFARPLLGKTIPQQARELDARKKQLDQTKAELKRQKDGLDARELLNKEMDKELDIWANKLNEKEKKLNTQDTTKCSPRETKVKAEETRIKNAFENIDEAIFNILEILDGVDNNQKQLPPNQRIMTNSARDTLQCIQNNFTATNSNVVALPVSDSVSSMAQKTGTSNS